MIISTRHMMFGFACVLGVFAFACSSGSDTAEVDSTPAAVEKAEPSQDQTAKRAGGGDASAKRPGEPGEGRADGGRPQPPAEVLAACTGKAEEDACTFTLDGGTLSGTCKSMPSGELGCLPEGGPPGGQR